jgi:adenine-specific DNA-methyltransferase
MQKLTAADPETHTPDLVAENLAALQALFPELITEGADGVAVNIDVLKALVGDKTVSDADEKYGLNWHGKRRARQLALTPSTGTLRPCPEDSVDWDTTQNLMIEGDNLEVLKLLQKSYAGKVKLIYIAHRIIRARTLFILTTFRTISRTTWNSPARPARVAGNSPRIQKRPVAFIPIGLI